MKKILLSTFLTVMAMTCYGQWQWEIDFENSSYLDKISIDTISNPNCLWQIGKPLKSIFTTAHSFQNALITDTLNSVPINDTSTFYLKHERTIFAPYHDFSINFWYRLDGDSTDFGIIEISPDNGLNWVNMLTQDTTYQFIWVTPKPILTGSTNNWQLFNVNMHEWASGFVTFPIAMTADTILFRFTYITDSNTTSKDGWMIDDFQVADVWQGVEEIENNNLVLLYPNPVKEKLSIKINQISPTQKIQIISYDGQVLYENNSFQDNYIDIKLLTDGLYFLKYSDSKSFSLKKFIVNH